MKGWQVSAYGEPGDVMALTELDDRRPGPGQVAVRVLGAALSFPDVLMCRGEYRTILPTPFTPGSELCGEVVAAGPSTAGFDIGQRIIGTPRFPGGALAEYALVDAAHAYPAPRSLGDAQAAAFHVAYQTSWYALHDRANLADGEVLLVHAAAGGVGSAALQLGRLAGARVIAVVGSPEKVSIAARLGAHDVIDRSRQDFVAVTRELVGHRGVDVVYDPVGGRFTDLSSRCVAPEGRILLVGFAAGRPSGPPLDRVVVRNYSIMGVHLDRHRELRPEAVAAAHHTLCGLAEQGIVEPLIGGLLRLEDASDGLVELAGGRTVGRLVVTP
jgi:NADPH2:quinone reductase